MHTSPYFDTCMWEVWQYCAASLAVLQYEEAGRRYPGTGRTGHEYSSTDTWPYHSVSPCQVWQYGADFLMYPSIASHLWRTDTLYPTWPCPLSEKMAGGCRKREKVDRSGPKGWESGIHPSLGLSVFFFLGKWESDPRGTGAVLANSSLLVIRKLLIRESKE